MKAERAERVLKRLEGFSDAHIDAQLSDGPTNASFLLKQVNEQYVLRIDKPGSVKLGLDRWNEKRVCAVVANAGLAPEPLYFDPAAGVYLRRFLPGNCWTASDLTRPDKLEQLASLLQRLHGLSPLGAAYEPLAAARRYARQLGGGAADSILRRAEEVMREITMGSPNLALCHNDLVCQNVLEGERLVLIDWEYAGIGDPLFDLAVVVRHHGLDAALTGRFLNAYLGRVADAMERSRMELQCEFYGCLLELWNLRVGGNRG